MIYDDYMELCATYSERYGDQTMVLMQVGDFFEVYAVNNDTEKMGADIYRLGDICNIQVTRKNKSILENNRSNPLMAGFPLSALQKHCQSLLSHNYTVVIVRQVTPPPNVTRKVTEVLSPGISGISLQMPTTDGTYFMVYYWENIATNLSVGIAGVDVTTGHTFAYEATSTMKDPSFAEDEAYRLMQMYNPKEIVLFGDAGNKKDDVEALFHHQQMNRCVHICWKKFTEHGKLAYQNEVIQRTYANKLKESGLLHPIEVIRLERHEWARVAFSYMIQFAYEHNENIISKLNLPDVLEARQHLTLEYNSAVQLNLIGCMPGDKPLLSYLNRCATAFGSRKFKDRLLYPFVEKQDIVKHHDRIESLITSNKAKDIHKLLSQVTDLDRLKRRIQLGTISPMDWCSMVNNMKCIGAVLEHCKDVLLDCEIHRSMSIVSNMRNAIFCKLDLDECAKYMLHDIRGNVFVHGIYSDIDEIVSEMQRSFEYLHNVANAITSLDPAGDSCLCKVESNERDGYFLQITKKRWETVNQKTKHIASIPLNEFSSKPISSSSSILRLSHSKVECASDSILKCQAKLGTMVTKAYVQFVNDFCDTWNEEFEVLIHCVTEIDIAATNARNAQEYGYTRPQVMDHHQNSYLNIKAMRHPLIERLQDNVAYVSNDIVLDAEQNIGVLLYGINASGKSSLMKAIGLNVIMAQAGMYVAAMSMTFVPYLHLFTRISGLDNIYRGMSSFTVEMSELRNILFRSDEKSLVLGDELCAGTESVSALAIISAGIDCLTKKKTQFVFATHLHELTDIPQIRENSSVQVYHMHIEIDRETGKIVYDRHLKPGRGTQLYGLEVCKALGMPNEFIKLAQQVRRFIQKVPDQFVYSQYSRYNKHVCVDKCAVCGNPASETHHIQYQCTADENGFITNGSSMVSVHHKSNLVPLCEACHLQEHNGQIKIHGYKQTSEGILLDVSKMKEDDESSTQDMDIDMDINIRDHFRYGRKGWYTKTSKGLWRATNEKQIYAKYRKLMKKDIAEHEIRDLQSLCLDVSC